MSFTIGRLLLSGLVGVGVGVAYLAALRASVRAYVAGASRGAAMLQGARMLGLAGFLVATARCGSAELIAATAGLQLARLLGAGLAAGRPC